MVELAAVAGAEEVESVGEVRSQVEAADALFYQVLAGSVAELVWVEQVVDCPWVPAAAAALPLDSA